MRLLSCIHPDAGQRKKRDKKKKKNEEEIKEMGVWIV